MPTGVQAAMLGHSFARCVGPPAGEPTCFLVVEPLAALDASLRLTLRSELVNLQKRLRTTMIFVTHDQVEAMTMGDRIGVMRNGRLEQIGTPNEIDNRPASLFVAGFV